MLKVSSMKKKIFKNHLNFICNPYSYIQSKTKFYKLTERVRIKKAKPRRSGPLQGDTRLLPVVHTISTNETTLFMVQSNTSGPLRFVHHITAWCIFCCSFATPPRSPALSLSLLCSFEFFILFSFFLTSCSEKRRCVHASPTLWRTTKTIFMILLFMLVYVFSLFLCGCLFFRNCHSLYFHHDFFLFCECVIHFLARFDLSLWTKRCRSDAHMLDLLGRYKLYMTLLDEFRLQKSQYFELHQKESGKG